MEQVKSSQVSPQQPKISDRVKGIKTYTIGCLSREFDVSLRALRFYEDRDLLHPSRQGSARLYSAKDRARLQIIIKGKKLGFTLTEIHDMLSGDDGSSVAGGQLLMNAEQVKTQIEHLERQKTELDAAIIELRSTHLRLLGGKKSVAA